MKIESLEVKNKINEIKTQIAELLDVFYPIGSFYETTNSSFDPNTEWSGTWEQDTKGYVTVGAYDPDDPRDPDDNGKLILNVRNTTGEVNHTLSINEMPSHNHMVHVVSMQVQGGSSNYVITYNPNGDIDTTWVGGSQPHNNVQPSIGVYCWHRIA